MAGKKRPFYSAQEALTCFRKGPAGTPHWEEAADYLIARANHDTRMLLDYALAKGRREAGERKRSNWGLPPAWLVPIATGVVAITVAAVGALLWAVVKYRCG